MRRRCPHPAALLQLDIKKHIKRDRDIRMDHIVAEAREAADAGDHKHLFFSLRMLSSFNPKPLTATYNGGLDRLLHDPLQIKLKWQEHFTELFGANIVDSLANLTTRPQMNTKVTSHGFHPTVDDRV